jgi:dienelactone hydrolase
VLEHHHNANGHVAAIGIGMGGSLAYEAAIVRSDLEAAVAFGGFPQRYIGHFKDAHIPILAFYGSEDEFVPRSLIDTLQQELLAPNRKFQHELVMLQGARHEIFDDDLSEAQRDLGREAWTKTLDFLDDYLEGPAQPPDRKTY